MPTDSDVVFCKINQNISEACYFYHKTAADYATAKAKCKSLGGDLVSWTSDEEQLTVETYFSDTNALASTYWLGLERVNVINSLYQWLDGTQVGNGYVSNTGGRASLSLPPQTASRQPW